MNNLTIVTEVVTPCACPIVATFRPTLYSAQLHDLAPVKGHYVQGCMANA